MIAEQVISVNMCSCSCSCSMEQQQKTLASGNSKKLRQTNGTGEKYWNRTNSLSIKFKAVHCCKSYNSTAFEMNDWCLHVKLANKESGLSGHDSYKDWTREIALCHSAEWVNYVLNKSQTTPMYSELTLDGELQHPFLVKSILNTCSFLTLFTHYMIQSRF